MQHIGAAINDFMEEIKRNKARTVNESKTPLDPKADEYRGEGGWLYCKKCGERRTEAGGMRDEVRRLCPCLVEEREKQKELEKQAEKQRRIEKLVRMSLLGDRYKDCNFENTEQGSESFNIAFKRCKRYCEVSNKVLDKGIGIYLFGNKGTGKTRLTACMANYLMRNYYTTLFTNFTEISKEIRASFNQKDNTEKKILNNISSVDFLFIDDLGVERVAKGEQDLWLQEKMYEIINTRYNNKSPIIFTSNLSLRELIETRGIDERTVDRIMEMTEPMKIEGNSFRARAKKNTEYLF